jgi:hypothetical protein
VLKVFGFYVCRRVDPHLPNTLYKVVNLLDYEYENRKLITQKLCENSEMKLLFEENYEWSNGVRQLGKKKFKKMYKHEY